MNCEKCGSELKEGSKFCDACGAEVKAKKTAKRARRPSAKQMMESGRKISENITLCEDGKFRWIYELGLFKNPAIFLLIWKIFFFIILGIFAVTMIVDAFSRSDFFPAGLLESLKFLGYFLIGMTALVGLGYLVYAAIMGGKYCVMFEMDESGVNHKQTDPQAKKAKKIAGATFAAGLATGRLTTAGIGLNSARTEMYSDFSRVKKVRPFPALHLIKVNGILSHNQVYAAKEDFDFVLKYILSHCENLKK